ncbi:helix-turn-helix domain-containing protein [Pseudonocardia sp. CA-142604]|uniref:helix-turn-helix domain-containing protein n=1 Tax=Pseudonocardia sp. CA-142604 TaxID=3240024 RepID=UPI003D916E54
MQILEYSGEELEDRAREIFFPVTVKAGPGFRGRAAIQELGETQTLSRSHMGRISAVRTGRMAAEASPDNLLLFCIYIDGHVRVRQHDRFAELAAGAGVLTEARSSYERASSTETQRISLRFSRELLPLRSAEITEACARSMDPTAPAMRMLSGYLGRLFKIADELTMRQRLDAGRAAIELLAMALRDVTPSVPGSDGSAAVLLDMMLTHVREHLADPNLQVGELARRHHVSVRRAYTLFEQIGTTPGAYLREQRLLAAQMMLSDPRYALFGVSRVAAAVGFRDLSTFDRAFRRQYGTTPASWRREHLRPGLLL